MTRDAMCGLTRKSPVSPPVRVKDAVQRLMKEKGLWNESLLPDIPKSWEKYGDMLLFNGEKYFRDPCWMQVHDLWQCICGVLNVRRIALKHHIVKDAFRTPNVTLVCGNNPWVEFKDNGIMYCWNIQRNMFCAGNAPERHRISTLQCENEVVVDMYAGIGYFTLPYLVKAKAKLVHACEWNPDAVKALRLNLNKNNVAGKCVIHEGDNTIVCPKYIADRVNLGLLPSSQSGWKTACEALNPVLGGILHVHENIISGLKHEVISKENSDFNTVPCETCLTIIQKCDLTRTTFVSDLKEQSSFIISDNAVLFTDEFVITWKQKEWKIWALHICHKLSEIFFTINKDTLWETVIVDVHHVKSYAPHIDHLVFDVKCTPKGKLEHHTVTN